MLNSPPFEVESPKKLATLHSFFIYKNVVFPAQAEYSYFSADFRLKIFLYNNKLIVFCLSRIVLKVFVFIRFCYLKNKEFVIILFFGLVHGTVISVGHFAVASAGFSFYWLVSPVSERNNFIRLS